MTAVISRHVVTVEGRWGTRQVHYRRAGSGPLVLLLHQSPQSSRELVPLMTQWAQHCAVVAPDSPGYGQSDALGVASAGLDDFAAATIEFLDAIGAGRFGVYGFHTGGMIGVALAHRYPDRVTAVVCNGIAVLTGDERRAILASYLPALEPRWDGGHLAWLWSRIREQNVFFPWHNHTAGARMDFPASPPERQQVAVLEFLRAAGHYHVAYRAAFTYPAADVVKVLAVPTLLTAAALDPIAPHLARLGERAAAVEITPSADSVEALDRAFAHVRSRPGDPGPAPESTQPVPGRLWADVVATPGGPLFVRRGGTSSGRPLLVLHGAGASGAMLAEVGAAFAPARPVLVPDLPGHGESDGQPGAAGGRIAASGRALAGILDALSVNSVDVLGVDGGAVLAVDLAEFLPARVRRAVLVNPPCLTEAQRATLRAGVDRSGTDWYGGHLLRAWHTIRDGRLYFPWCQRDRAGIRWGAPDLDDRRIHVEATELLKSEGAWQDLFEAQLDYPLAEKLAAAGSRPGRVVLASTASCPVREPVAAAAVAAGLAFIPLSDDPAGWVAALAGILD